jgi:hypothetical protein
VYTNPADVVDRQEMISTPVEARHDVDRRELRLDERHFAQDLEGADVAHDQ